MARSSEYRNITWKRSESRALSILQPKETENILLVFRGLGRVACVVLTLPVMTMQPSWSMMSTSSWDGGWQNFCCRICRMGSITLGVSLRATAM
ncbi:hypothetical protein EYF80_035336 [Liparis tanakae]|uniref:Uncharacterized protein n=1 Tax=Liparis tanakae TaxID=230148 RepID=A0A4Z2GLK5_9TELE|nr:hypothetical protein EYF80_035336 [Liparis tanakae]